MKFGGTSVASAAGWATIRSAAERARADGHRVFIVCSALATVSNTLATAIDRAVAGEDYTDELELLRQVHRSLADDLGVPLPAAIPDLISEVRDHLFGARLLEEASPRVRARVLSAGELMSTRLGVAWLEQQGVDVAWCDSRELLDAKRHRGPSDGRRYLSATVQTDGAVLDALPDAGIAIGQGFIASDDDGDTVLLGRGGSDTSAAYYGVLLGAERVEIWTDVPGLFTANPQRIPTARHLERLAYDEVAAMASLGVRALHPRCVEPLCNAGVPLHVKSTYLPDAAGTVVEGDTASTGVKAVTGRSGLLLLQLSRPSQWQPVGFVADVSACFKRHGLSIDLMSTSPSTITATVDPSSSPGASIDALVEDLHAVCESVHVQQPVASVSLVGTAVRESFADVGRALDLLDGVDVQMVAQGAADHHLTFVVDQRRSRELVEQLHTALLARGAMASAGPSFAELDGHFSLESSA
jgi:diaminopimelate decarboxylase/aspartate kinase